eukprot:TRINITY_DN20542_c0_g1_i1.p1 TRINITY_DN20542_c0_g1~~TRINITY_DN20542_c0_g1_i1.p1  ORF type:complete len:745 (-),score=105.62 TRINITY_DN20542_c0_g1_i1:52-2223(-)
MGAFNVASFFFVAQLSGLAQGISGPKRQPQGAYAANTGVAFLRAFQVGSFEGGADVVSAGRSLPGWTPRSPARIAATEPRTRLWALLTEVGVPAAPLQSVAAVSQTPDVATASASAFADGVSGSNGNDLEVGDPLRRPLVVDIAYTCVRSGLADIMIEYRFASARSAPVVLSVQKECAALTRVGLDVGSSRLRRSDVVREGVSHWTTATASRRLVPASTQRTELFLSLKPHASAYDSAWQVLAAPRVLTTPLVEGDADAGPVQQTTPPRSGWRRQLLDRGLRLAQLRHAGLWGLPSDDGDAEHDSPAADVRLGGTLAAGGPLSAATGSLLQRRRQPPGLVVDFVCRGHGLSLVEIELAPYPAYQPFRPTVVSFVKQCGDILHNGFGLASYPLHAPWIATPDLVSDEGVVVGRLGTIDNTQRSTAVFWRSHWPNLGPPDATRLNCAVRVGAKAFGGSGDVPINNRSVANVSLAGPVTVDASMDESGLLAGHQTVLSHCVQPGVVQCTLQFGWRLHGGPSISFTKVCGGIRSDVDVVSDLQTAKAVVLRGQEAPQWSANPAVVLPPEENRQTFTVMLDKALEPGKEALKVAPPTIRVLSPDVVNARLSGDLVLGGEVSSNVSAKSMDIEVITECLETGSSRIEVTLPLGGGEPFKPLTFAFLKRCYVVSYWQQWWISVLAIFLLIFLVSCTALLVGVIHLQRGYQAEEKKKGEFKSSRPREDRAR